MTLASYNERLMYETLTYLELPFISEFRFEDSTKRYDFWVENVGLVELHGSQHYKDFKRHPKWHSYEIEHKNDLYKYDLAVLHGYEFNKDYFVVDCSSADPFVILNGILDILKVKITEEEIEEILVRSENDLTIVYCEYWKNNNHPTPSTMSEVFGVALNTIIRHLHRGYRLGLCEYTTELARREQIERHGGSRKGTKQTKEAKLKMSEAKLKYREFRGTHKTTGEKVVFSNRFDLKEAGFDYAHVVSCGLGQRKTHKGYTWEVAK